MRKILSASFERVKKIFFALTLMLIINFIAVGQPELIGALLIGYLLAAFYVISAAARLSSISNLSPDSAKRQMLFGLILRLVMLSIVLIVTLKISEKIFYTVAISFLTFYLIAQLGLILNSYKMPFQNDDDKNDLSDR